MQTAKKQSLVEQILLYRRRISQYQALSSQIKNVSQTIQNFSTSRQKFNSTTFKSLSKKRIQDDYNSFLKSGLQRQTSSSKKIKIYELQKKFFRLGKEHNQKLGYYMFDKRQLEVNTQTCKKLSSFIDKQEIRRKTLNKQNQELIIDANQISLNFQSTQLQLDSIQAKKLTILRQKDQIICKLQKLKTKLQQFKVQSLVSQQNHFQENSIKQCKEFYSQQSRNSLNYLKYNNVHQNLLNKNTSKNQVLIQDSMYDVIESKSSVNIVNTNFQHQIKKQYLQKLKAKKNQNRNVNYDQINQGNSSKSDCISVGDDKLQNKRVASTQLTDTYLYKNKLQNSNYNLQTKQVYQLNKSNLKRLQTLSFSSQILNKLQLLKNTCLTIKDRINIFQQQIISIQTEIRHHCTSLNLLKNKISSFSFLIQRQNSKQLSNISKIQQLHIFLSQKQGYRGQIRGRIGTRVQQQTLLKMLNLTINKDLQFLNQKICLLNAYQNLITQQIVKNIQ